MELTFGQAILAYFVSPLLTLLTIVVFVNVIMSWLVAFNVVNAHNQFVRMVWQTTEAIVAPLLAPIRRILPPLGGMDLSPIVLLLLIAFVRNYIVGQVLWRLFG
ncbi:MULTISPECIES: YggT family protein [Marinicauda]|jgi:YggT family protein|uniref:YggT family protein n=1 Tax=Marinicauda pacifica TaxID=1133559 RepID=A0A4S2HBH7_9PROT|nr:MULTISPECIES: YggT family protein [Marinicauda]TGY93256.1 YggT family protein [Marinicauda pacifica]